MPPPSRYRCIRLLLELLESRLAPAVHALPDYYYVGVNTPLVVSGGQAILAQSGFNDQSGINSDPAPNSPFELGASVHGRGVSEPGWSGGWFVSDGGCACGFDLGQAVSTPTFEGDGALHVRLGLFRETWMHRAFESQSDYFLLEQRVRLPANGNMASRPYGSEQGPAAFGPVWGATTQFGVYQGDGQGSGAWIETGIPVLPLRWYNVSILADVQAQTYEFFVDGVKYESAVPLRFRGSPAAILNVDYLADSDLWLDAIRIRSLDRLQQWATPRGVLHNDITGGSGPLAARLEGALPEHGDLEFLPDGGFVYTPHPGFAGTDSFTYVASGDGIESQLQTVAIEVIAVPSVPVVRDDAYQVPAGSRLVIGGGGTVSTIAQSGFNDNGGINATEALDHPYQFGQTIHGRGGSEPGWAGLWRVSDGGCACGEHLGQAQGDVGFEGDGGLHVRISDTFRETWISRQWAEQQFDRFYLEQMVRLPANGILGSRPYGNESGLAAFGPVWWIVDGRVFAHDGDGQGGTTPEDTGFRAQPLTWHQVTLYVDVANQVFDFYFDGVRYEAPDPLNFRGSPSSIQWIDYLFDSEGWIDAVRMISVDAPLIEGVLANDESVNGPFLAAYLVSGPAHGTLAFGSNGGFVYIPEPGFVGEDIFTYRASDSYYDSEVATVTILVGQTAPSRGTPLDGFQLVGLEFVGDLPRKRR